VKSMSLLSQIQTETTPSPQLLADGCGARWYAVYTVSRHEKRVARGLMQRRLDCFLPTYRSVRRWKDRRQELELALFPGYVFVHVERKDRLQIIQVPSVVNIVSFDGQPAPIPDAEIEALRRGLATQTRMEPHPYLKVGKRVRIHSGPMVGQEGILIRRKDSLRVVLSLDFIMRSVSVEVDLADIEPAR
jgi:transcription antitermination factor NusG